MLETSSQSKQTPQEKEFFNNNTATSNNSPTRCRGNGLAHCDLDSPVKKQLKLSNTCEEKKRRERELNSAPDPVSDLGSSPHVEQEEVEQENCAPAPDTGMSSCEGPHTAGRVEMVETLMTSSSAPESDDADSAASDSGNGHGNHDSVIAKNNNNNSSSKKPLSWRQNKRKQSRPQRCSTYLKDRNNTLDSAFDVGDAGRESDEEYYSDAFVAKQQTLNGHHAMEVEEVAPSNGVATYLNGHNADDKGHSMDDEDSQDNGYAKYYSRLGSTFQGDKDRPPSGLPCVFTIQPTSADYSDADSPMASDHLDSYVLMENDLSERENGGGGTPLSATSGEGDAAPDAAPAPAHAHSSQIPDHVINIEPVSSAADSAAASAANKEDVEPGEVVNALRARALAAGGGGMSLLTHPASGLGIPDLAAGARASPTTAAAQQQPTHGRTPLRHRRTIGELYGLMNPQRRGRGGATNHIAMKYRRDCPIPGCGARYLTNLCDHLKKTHGLGPEERRPWLEKAKRIHQQKQLQEQQQQGLGQQQQQPQQQRKRGTSSPSSITANGMNGTHGTPTSSSSTSGSTSSHQMAQAAAAAANLAAASPALAAIALATGQSNATGLSSSESLAMAMSQIPLNSAALLMQQAQALSLLTGAQPFPTPSGVGAPPSAFSSFLGGVGQGGRGTAAASAGFPGFGALGSTASASTGARVRAPWNSSGARKNCPVPGCGAKSLLNLSDHLSKVHSMTRDERQPWLQQARDQLA